MTAAAAVVGAVIWFLWPDQHWVAEGDAAATVVGSVSAWLYFELFKSNEDKTASAAPVSAPETAVHPHDLELLSRFNRLVPLADRVFLREHDFRTPFDSRHLDGFETLADGWLGADYEFHDAACKTAFRHLQNHSRELVRLAGRYLFSDDRNVDIVTPLNDADRRGGLTPQTDAHIRELNTKSEQVIAALDHFISLSRERIERG